MTQPSQVPERGSPPYGWAALAALVVFAIYLATLAPTTAFWDTSEYIAAAKVLGIPHPPGNPLFVILAHSFGLLPLSASYAVRINLFAALTSALSAGLWLLVAERWLRAIVPPRGLRLATAFAGVLVGATMWTVWNQSTVNEKVYTLSLLSMAVGTWLAVHWGDDAPGPHRDRWLILIAYTLALTSTNHMMGVLAGPAIAVYVLWTDWRLVTRPWVLLMGWLLLLALSNGWGNLLSWIIANTVGLLGPRVELAPSSAVILLVTLGLTTWALLRDRRNPLLYLGVVAVLVGVSLNYVFLPMRAMQLPAINEGEPTGWQALLDVLNRVQYGKPSVMLRQADFQAQLAMYWQYFSWQFARDWGGVGRVATALFTVLGLSGLWTLLRRDRRAGVAAAAMLFTVTLSLIFYLNFRYGYSIYPDRQGLDREVRERDYFFICSFAFFGTLVAAGLGAWIRGLAEFLEARAPERYRWLAGTPLLALALVPLLGNRVTATRAEEFAARDFARDLLESVEPYGVLITAGDNDTFPLWYAQEVEGIRPDVTLANLSLMNTDWHLRQLRRRQIPDFDPSKSLPMWKPGSDVGGVPLGDSSGVRRGWPKPRAPVFALSERELDSLPELARAPSTSLRFDSLEIHFGTDVLDRKDLAVIFLIRDNLGKRPVYFSWSVGTYPDQTLGLTPYLVSQGLVRKLYPKPVVAKGSIVMSAGLGWMDLDRTRALIEKGYKWQSAARRRPRGWVDAPSRSILELYGIVYAGAAATLREHGETALAARADSIAEAVRVSLEPARRTLAGDGVGSVGGGGRDSGSSRK